MAVVQGHLVSPRQSWALVPEAQSSLGGRLTLPTECLGVPQVPSDLPRLLGVLSTSVLCPSWVRSAALGGNAQGTGGRGSCGG